MLTAVTQQLCAARTEASLLNSLLFQRPKCNVADLLVKPERKRLLRASLPVFYKLGLLLRRITAGSNNRSIEIIFAGTIYMYV